MARDCPKGFSVCFHCNQMGYRKVECPKLIQGSTQGSAPTAIRATDSQSVKNETSRAHGRAFQLTTEEVRASPDLVAGMYFPLFLLF